MRQFAVIAILGGALAACAGADKEPPINVPPTSIKTDITSALTRDLSDPTNIRDAAITDPMRDGAGPYYVCLRYNPREYGVYAGRKERVVYFFEGRINQIVDATPALCAKAAYKPFPELEKLCQAEKC